MSCSKMKAQSLTFRSGDRRKKAFIFTLDAFLATLMMIFVLSVSAAYAVNEKNILSEFQAAKIGSDIAVLMKNSNVLNNFNKEEIQAYLDSVLSSKYGMRINLVWADAELKNEKNIEFGEALPKNKFIATGKRFFVLTNTNSSSVNNYAYIKYWIWLK